MQNRLIVCLGSLQAGGAERVLSVLSKNFADSFDEVEYILWLDWRFPDVFYNIDSRVKIIGISEASRSTNVFKHMLWFRTHVKEFKPTSILSFFEMISLCVITSLLGTKNRIVVSERNDPRFFSHSKLYRNLINFAYRSSSVKRIIMQTQYNKDYFLYSKLYNKTSVIFNPVQFANEEIGSAFSTPKENVIVSAARLAPQKKQELLIEAFGLFVQSHPGYKLKIFGEGPCRSKLEDLVNKLKLQESVILPGKTKNIWEEMKKAKVFVMSSEYEGMSNSLIEAMALGVPCISTKVSGATDFIQDGVNGYLVEQNDVFAISERMGWIVDDEVCSQEMSKSSSQIYTLLNLDRISKQWIDLLCND